MVEEARDDGAGEGGPALNPAPTSPERLRARADGRPALARWGEGATKVGEEIRHGGVASRVWRADYGGAPVILKLILDRPAFAVPGLAVSAALARRGLRSGPPLETLQGEPAVEVGEDDNPSWTLAMLRYEAGDPLDPAAFSAPELAADLLARVHALVLSTAMPEVPARILDWAEATMPQTSGARPAVARLKAAGSGLTQGILYGDPSPEILVARGRSPALIDWGTPSWGPLIYDLAAWALRFSAGDRHRFDRFVSRYQEHSVLAPAEHDQLADAVLVASSPAVTPPV